MALFLRTIIPKRTLSSHHETTKELKEAVIRYTGDTSGRSIFHLMPEEYPYAKSVARELENEKMKVRLQHDSIGKFLEIHKI